MVKNATSYSGSGLRDWLIQRVTAMILALYVIFLAGYILLVPKLTFVVWESLFSHMMMKVATLFALLALIMHAWIGMWTILTDYVKCVCIRLVLEIAIVIALVSYFIWGAIILWSV